MSMESPYNSCACVCVLVQLLSTASCCPVLFGVETRRSLPASKLMKVCGKAALWGFVCVCDQRDTMTLRRVN